MPDERGPDGLLARLALLEQPSRSSETALGEGFGTIDTIGTASPKGGRVWSESASPTTVSLCVSVSTPVPIVPKGSVAVRSAVPLAPIGVSVWAFGTIGTPPPRARASHLL